jgi:hypothetical protein
VSEERQGGTLEGHRGLFFLTGPLGRPLDTLEAAGTRSLSAFSL